MAKDKLKVNRLSLVPCENGCNIEAECEGEGGDYRYLKYNGTKEIYEVILSHLEGIEPEEEAPVTEIENKRPYKRMR